MLGELLVLGELLGEAETFGEAALEGALVGDADTLGELELAGELLTLSELLELLDPGEDAESVELGELLVAEGLVCPLGRDACASVVAAGLGVLDFGDELELGAVLVDALLAVLVGELLVLCWVGLEVSELI